MRTLIFTLALAMALSSVPAFAEGKRKDPKTEQAINKALEYLARSQRRQGYWEANSGQYRVAMTALAGTALLCEGSTTTTGKYADNIRRAVDYLVQLARPNGLIGYQNDNHYTYGHGYSMLFLSQVYGEEEDAERRNDLKRVLTNAVRFCSDAQTSRGGWGYVSAKDGSDFDEGSTCITQVQGLRACRNAGIPVPVDIINRAKKYIKDCTMSDGGLRYSYMTQSGTRPPITAAAVAGMFNVGEHNTPEVKKMMEYCKSNVWPGKGNGNDGGHWHYMHYYWAQVMYREGDEKWQQYWNDVGQDIIRKQAASGEWVEGYVGPVYTTAINATILQLDNGYLPIYQR